MKSYIQELMLIGPGVRSYFEKEIDGKNVENKNSMYLWDGYSVRAFVHKWKDGTPESTKKKAIKWTLVSPEGYIVDNVTHMTSPCSGSGDVENQYKFSIPGKFCSAYRDARWLLHVYTTDGKLDDNTNYTASLYPKCNEIHVGISKAGIYHSNKKIEDSQKIDFGTSLTISLDTVGLYGTDCLISIYSDKDSNNPVFQKEEKCRFGEITLWNIPTIGWHNKGDRFYVEIQVLGKQAKKIKKLGGNTKIIYINFTKKVASNLEEATKMNESISLTTIKDSNVDNPAEYDHCKFSKMNIKVGDREEFPLFDENSLLPGNATREYSPANSTSYFEFDKDDLTAKARTDLAALAKIIAERQLTVTIGGHADSRGGNAYNIALSERRANAVANVLRENGVKDQYMKLYSYGKNNQPNPDAEDENEHQINRQAELKVTVSGLILPYTVHNLIGHDDTDPEPTKLTISGFTIQDCTQDHNGILSVSNLTNGSIIQRDIKINKDPEINIYSPQLRFQGFKSLIDNMFSSKNKAAISNLYNRYRISLNTCAYYPRKENDLAEINFYPDSRFVFHAMLNALEADRNYRVNNFQAIQLDPGIEFDNTSVKNLVNKHFTYDKIFANVTKQEIIEIIDALTSVADDMFAGYQFGVHTLYNFNSAKTSYKITTHTKDYSSFFEVISWIGVIIGILIEILIIVLTYGGGAVSSLSKLKTITDKIQKFEKLLGKLSPAKGIAKVGLDINYLKAIIAGEIFFNNDEVEGKPDDINLNYRLIMQLKPLLGITAELKFPDASGYIPEGNNATGEIIEKLGGWLTEKLAGAIKNKLGVEFTVKLSGDITAELDTNFQYQIQKFMWKQPDPQKLGNVSKEEVGGRITLFLEIKLDGVKIAQSSVGVSMPWAAPVIKDLQMRFFPDMKAEVIAYFTGSVGLIIRRQFDARYMGPYMEFVAVAFPIFGKFDANFALGKKKGEDEDSDKNETPLNLQDETENGDLIWEGGEFVLFRISIADLFSSGSPVKLLPE